MPPSLPTGTVSQTSTGTRTFPPEPDSESDRERVPVASTGPSRPSKPESLPTTPSPGVAPAAVVPRREHDAAIAREHDRVATLARENRALREHIRDQSAERQAVIERYERLLERRDVSGSSSESSSTAVTSSPPSTPSFTRSRSADGVVDSVKTTASALYSRLAGLVGPVGRD